MKVNLVETSKLKKIQIDYSKVLHHLILMENKIVELLKKFKENYDNSDNRKVGGFL